MCTYSASLIEFSDPLVFSDIKPLFNDDDLNTLRGQTGAVYKLIYVEAKALEDNPCFGEPPTLYSSTIVVALAQNRRGTALKSGAYLAALPCPPYCGKGEGSDEELFRVIDRRLSSIEKSIAKVSKRLKSMT